MRVIALISDRLLSIAVPAATASADRRRCSVECNRDRCPGQRMVERCVYCSGGAPKCVCQTWCIKE
ncbi:hypothetical protein [Pseudonocardia sp. TRM90224]|uniref:hypothetical protein n=1 Tax=Pseudonocardia sp. TRM90224 TaxID=2812678 RepID=UPI001E451C4F|nr:hypothetical protein [Pseudonocardia sp. TRM90224]